MLVCLLAPLAGVSLADFGDFPGNPSESPRVNTPNDPEFDRCEEDDEDPPVEGCESYFNEQFGSFGFNPDSARDVEPIPGVSRTDYEDCSQLDAQGKEANTDAGDPECSQIAGVRADTAWKYSIGSPDTTIAILDTGIEWQSRELIEKVHLNRDELPEPNNSRDTPLEPFDGDEPCNQFDAGVYDANDDGAFNVRDYACDSRVQKEAGDTESDGTLDASDLIATFSGLGDTPDDPDDGDINNDGDLDDDGNGYDDDIAGWDFFDDDNDPFDASSCCSADGHGTGRAGEAARQTNDGRGKTGMCPECQVMPIRVWDTFVVDSNLFSLGVVYATDNGADVVEGAVGGLLNSNFARRAFTYADEEGVTLTLVSSDINSANHNYPTNYNEAIYVAGSLPDSAPSDCGIPSAPGLPDLLPLPDFAAEPCGQFFDFLSDRTGETTPPTTQPPTTSFFRNSNLTQYGGKADVVLMGSTGSENTGQASGAAGLLASYGREELGSPLSGNEIRQLLTMTAEDVMLENTGVIGQPDKANDGWEPHFGYGRVNLAGAMDRIQENRVPPEAQLDAPDWFAPINVDRVGANGVPIEGRVGGGHTDAGDWELEYACGQDALDADFQPVPGANGSGETTGELGRLSQADLQNLANNCEGDVDNDFGRPSGRATDPPGDPYPDPDPERHAFQIRLTVHEPGDAANVGRYRKTLFAYNDDGNLAGWPKPIGSSSEPAKLVTGSGGETPPRLADLDADNELDVILGTSSGELHVLDDDGDPLASFNGGEPVRTDRYAQASSHDRPADSLSGAPREPLRAPAIGDLDGDGEPEIVATAGEHIYAWHRDGDVVDGFPARLDPDLSEPCVDGVEKPCFNAADRAITHEHHIKRGFLGAPALADLDGDSGLDIVAGALDQHVYAFDGDGDPLQGFNNGEPVELDADGDPATGAEIPTSPTIADLDGDGDPEIVMATNEVLDAELSDDSFPNAPGGILDAFVRSGLGQAVVYAVDGDGSMFPGEWPVKLGALAGDILPLVVPANDAAAVNADGDAGDEVAVSAATADAKLVDGDGSTIKFFSNDGSESPNVTDRSMQLNLADYPSVGELTDGTGPSVVKGGISLNGVANLLAVNQNLPFNHVVQAWRAEGATDPQPYDAGYPLATDDFQLVSQPGIAKVDDGPLGRQALVGTGMYQLHAYGPGPLGEEPGEPDTPDGWPKFLGGWVQPTPASGDVDGDGDLEVTAVTREGWSFVWETGADACQEGSVTTNQEWWTFHHDEFGTANYGTDARPPSRPGQIDVDPGAGDDLELSFTASGDDLACGTPERYEARGFDEPPQSAAEFDEGTELEVEGDPRPGGQQQDLTLRDAANFDFVLIRAVDDAGNVSYIRAAATPERPKCKGVEATIVGTPDADEIRGTLEDDVIVARGGNDDVVGRSGVDMICAQGGDDVVEGNSGADEIHAGSGEDSAQGGSGDDELYGNSGADDLEGGDGDDRLEGGDGDDELRGKAGDDDLFGEDGDDELYGGSGADRLRGGAGDDKLRGDSGSDDVAGGSGQNDVKD